MLYFAYGSNLLKAGMRARCPAAEPLSRADLPGHQLVFRSWADVEPAREHSVAGGLWRITPTCLAALDVYEEVEAGLYRRLTLSVVIAGGTAVEAIIYRMNAALSAPPDPPYLTTILDGCRDFGLDRAPVLAAAEAARSSRG